MEASRESARNDELIFGNAVTPPLTAAETLGTRLRTARQRKSWTQQTLASRATTTQSVIQKIEEGKSLRPRNIVAIARALGVEPSWLMFGVKRTAPLSPEALAVAKAWSELAESERRNLKEKVTQLSRGL